MKFVDPLKLMQGITKMHDRFPEASPALAQLAYDLGLGKYDEVDRAEQARADVRAALAESQRTGQRIPRTNPYREDRERRADPQARPSFRGEEDPGPR